MLTDADKNLSKVEILELKQKIVEVLEEPYSLEYADSAHSKFNHFDRMINLPSRIKKFYALIALHPEFEITDIIEKSSHTLVTLAAENGYAYLIPHFAKFKIDLTKAAPNGLTAASVAAAHIKTLHRVVDELEKLGIKPSEHAAPSNPHPI